VTFRAFQASPQNCELRFRFAVHEYLREQQKNVLTRTDLIVANLLPPIVIMSCRHSLHPVIKSGLFASLESWSRPDPHAQNVSQKQRIRFCRIGQRHFDVAHLTVFQIACGCFRSCRVPPPYSRSLFTKQQFSLGTDGWKLRDVRQNCAFHLSDRVLIDMDAQRSPR
jgi:hypothetical protein